jgi:hypothetical protein
MDGGHRDHRGGGVAHHPSVRRRASSHWPGLVGLLVAIVQIVTGVDAEGVATTVAAAASCYLAAAAVGQRWVAWVGILLVSVVVVVGEIAGILWWAAVAGYAVVLLSVGWHRRSPAPVMTEQGLAMLGFGGLAVGALLLSPDLALFLAGFALASHALWDYRHWRRDDVVPRSLAEFCILLDVPLGGAAMILASTG